VFVVNLGAVNDEYCHNEEFVAECYDGNVILMTLALYGRMAVGRCVKTDFGFVGCYKDVINELNERCTGRSYCSVRVPDTKLDSTDPCHVDLKSYLQATYICITGTYWFIMRPFVTLCLSVCPLSPMHPVNPEI